MLVRETKVVMACLSRTRWWWSILDWSWLRRLVASRFMRHLSVCLSWLTWFTFQLIRLFACLGWLGLLSSWWSTAALNRPRDQGLLWRQSSWPWNAYRSIRWSCRYRCVSRSSDHGNRTVTLCGYIHILITVSGYIYINSSYSVDIYINSSWSVDVFVHGQWIYIYSSWSVDTYNHHGQWIYTYTHHGHVHWKVPVESFSTGKSGTESPAIRYQ